MSTTFQKGLQYGFYFDQGRCVDCKTCVVACKSWNNVDPGPAKWLRMFEWETGTFPNVTLHALFAPCYHCANPVCVTAAKGAMFKEPNYGAVLIDPQLANTSSMRDAATACPYGAIVFDSDSPTANASKCTLCIDRLEQGLLPLCVASCMERALDFGSMDQLVKKYGNVRQIESLPAASATTPSIVFKARIEHQTLIPYDASQAIQLMAKRDPYPAIFTDQTLLTPKPGVVGRASLNLTPKNSAELRTTKGRI